MNDAGPASDDGIIQIYTDELIALAEQADKLPRVENPDISARAISPVCGSVVAVDILLDGDKIKTLGFTSEACALTRAVLAVLHGAAPGKTRADIADAARLMASVLAGGGGAPSGDWTRLALLAPVRDYPSRHNALMLPFEAVEKAFQTKKP